MKVPLLLLFFGIIFVSACTTVNDLKQKTICGDGICDVTESCACSDCASSEFCQSKNVAQNCDDNNECTVDSFNPATNACVYEKKQNCCGNSICESTERECDLSTYTTRCGKDCSLSCPTKLVLTKEPKTTLISDQYPFKCSDSKCEQISDTHFRIKDVSSVETILTNFGEISSDVVTSSFTCYLGSTKIAVEDNDIYDNMIFKDFFNENFNKLDSINSKANPNNSAIYKFQVNITKQISPKDLTCSIALTSSPSLQNIYELKITVY